MNFFLYEHVTAGGCPSDTPGEFPAASLRCEGAAMIVALATDFAAIAGAGVSLLGDACFARESLPDNCRITTVAGNADRQAVFFERSAAADWTIVIAPETGGTLARCARMAQNAGGRLLSPNPETIELCADKLLCGAHLASHGIATPVARALESGRSPADGIPFPAVCKPRDGAGSQGVRWVLDAAGRMEALDRGEMLQAFHHGEPVSVAALCGPAAPVMLPPCRQRISSAGCFTYLGGSLPLPPPKADRATRLARAAIESLPNPVGYVGVDLVLGDDESGAGDVVIEINPRLTTSYVGLRVALRENLARLMLDQAAGNAAPPTMRPGTFEFDADGGVRVES